MAAENENSNDDQSSKYLKINDQIVNNLIPDDALTYNGHSYKFFNDGMTWEEAKTYCESMGGHLLTITDSGEQAFVEHLLANGSKNNFGWAATRAITASGN